MAERITVVVDLAPIFEEELAVACKVSSDCSREEAAMISSFCDDVWDQLCIYSFGSMVEAYGGSAEEARAELADEAVNMMFNYFDEIQFSDLENDTVLNYLRTQNEVPKSEDYVGDYLFSAELHYKVFSFAVKCMSRINRDIFYPIFKEHYSEVISVEKLPFKMQLFKLTVEIP